MSCAVLKGAGYVLAHAPDMVIHNGTTQTTERIINPDSEYLKNLRRSLRTYEQALCYAPNQTYIGNITPNALKAIPFPWYDKESETKERFGEFGEIMPEDEFIGLMQIADTFDLVKFSDEFSHGVREKLSKHPILENYALKIKEGEPLDVIKSFINDSQAEALYVDDRIVGCVKKAHDIDVNLNAHVMFENLVAKASGALAFLNLMAKYDLDVKDVDYVIECSEEACGDMNQRGGGNFAKSIAEMVGAVNATGSDTRGFCAAPVHALIEAASLVKAGTYESVVVVAGGATAKLGMNGKDHVKKGLPVIEDVIGAFAVLVGRNDGCSPVLNTDIVGRHTVGTGSSPQAVITSLVAAPLEKAGLKITDIDKYSVEMQNPDITKPAGAGDVPEANYKMIAALAVMKKNIERADIPQFIETHGMTGWAPTQGHIPSGIPYLGFAREELMAGRLNKTMFIGKGSLFLGRMTNLFDGVSIVLEQNQTGTEEGSRPEVAAVSEPVRRKKRIGLTLLGSEHGIDALIKGAELAHRNDDRFEIVLIGPRSTTSLETVEASDEKSMYAKMESLLDNGHLDGCVTMHYTFPSGVSTVGRVFTPGQGRDLFLAATTGMSSANRIEAMVRNALHGVITAKAMGIKEPTVGILNLDGARQAERILADLNDNGYTIHFSHSARTHDGMVMRGNDLLIGSADVMVTDTLTGNILMKLFSSYTTGGNYEASGFGYGPGIGESYDRLVLILSRASGIPVVANALCYAARLAEGNVFEIAKNEFKKAKKAGLNELLSALGQKPATGVDDAVKMPEKEVVTEEITGIDVMELEDAVKALWRENIYAESGMGCTGPVILISGGKREKAATVLSMAGFIRS